MHTCASACRGIIAIAKPRSTSSIWAVLLAIFVGGVAAVGTLANYAEDPLRAFFIVVTGILGALLAYVMLPLRDSFKKNAAIAPCG